MLKQLSRTDWAIMKKLDSSLMNQLSNLLSNLNRNDSNLNLNHKLAGQIDDEYNIKYPIEITEFIFKSLKEYSNDINNIESLYRTPKEYNEFEFRFPEDSWVNFQKKYEYNPIHHHSGDFSFVIWYKIPYKKEDEYMIGPGKNDNLKTNGSFAFIYDIAPGKVDTKIIPGDTSMEGTLLIFPANLGHCVYPFYTSDDERISFSGNFYHKPNYNIKITNTLM